MDDLIERLRALSRHAHSDFTIGDEAADRIAALERSLAVAGKDADEFQRYVHDFVGQAAMAELHRRFESAASA